MISEPAFKTLAEAFIQERVDTVFMLMGDGNMHWGTAMAAHEGVRIFHVRHEHCACAMAQAYALATDKVGVASVTCGPGLTQLMTALSTAARACIPLVVFAGDSPIHASFYNQRIDQAPLVMATGAHHIEASSLTRMLEHVREAFYVARMDRRPVVLSIPYDLQKQPLPNATYRPSTDFIPTTGRMPPDPAFADRAAQMIAAAKRQIVVAGRGAFRSGAQAECEALADICGGLLATTLPARGLFEGNARSIGIAGGFAHAAAREKFAEADLIVAVGASLTYFTVEAGTLFPEARRIQIDTNPQGLKDGLKVADIHLRADAKAGLEAVNERLRALNARPGEWWTPELARRIAEEPADSVPFEIEAGTLDPRDAVAALDHIIPKDWEMVSGSGHSSYFSAQMRGRRAENYHTIREFGAIGNGLSYAIGVAAARPDKTVVLIDGDGGLLMHAQELETIRRHGLKILICVLNDGAYGSEIHKLRSEKLDDSGATFGRGNLGRMARGFGLRGATVTDLNDLEALIEGFRSAATSELWDIHISDQVTSPVMRKIQNKAH